MEKGQRAVFYARVSTEEEKQLNALEKQVTECRDVIKAMGWECVDEFIDEGKSGTKTKGRDEYNRLMDALYEDDFDIVVIKSQDRLMRNVKDWYIFLDRLITHGKRLYMYIENKFYTTDDALITGIKAILAEEYSRELSKKLKNAHKRRAERAKAGESVYVMAGGLTIGYNMINGEMVINEDEAKLVRLVYKRYLEGLSYRKLANELNDLGYRNKNGNLFEVGTIKHIITNERYKGVYVLNRWVNDFDKKKVVKNDPSKWVEVEGIIPAIIDKEVWEKAQEIRLSRTKGKRGVKHGDSIFSGKLYCGKCGGKYWKESHKKGVRFRCSNYVRYGTKKCVNRSFYERDLYNALAELCELIVEPNEAEIRKSLLKMLEAAYEALSGSEEDDKIAKELEKEKKRKDKLIEAYMDELISKEDFTRKQAEVDNRIEKLSSTLKTQNTTEEMREIQRVIDNIDDEIKLYMATADFEKEKINYLLEHITRITVFEDSWGIELDLTGGIMFFGDKLNLFVNKERYFCLQTEHYKLRLKIAA